MAMELFKKERRAACFMINVKGKMKRMKGGGGSEGARAKMVKIDFEVPITSKIRELLDPKLQALINLDGGEGAVQEFPINSICPAQQNFEAIVSVFSKQNWTAAAKPIWTGGGSDEGFPTTMLLKKISIKEKATVLVIEVTTPFTDVVWKWAGDALDGCDCIIKFKPHQQELPLVTGDEKEKDEDGDDDKE